MNMIEEVRYKEEQLFWDKQISGILNDPNYSFKRPNLPTFEKLCKGVNYLNPILDYWGNIHKKRILDLACGDGWISLSLGKSGAIINGCDISPNLIKLAQKYALESDLDEVVKFDTMRCEEITYKDNTFDFVIMHAALHHCDIEKTSDQIYRVLKLGGKAVLIEDYAYHPLLNFYRFLTPDKHTKSEKALTDEDLEIVVSRFSKHFYKHYGLFNLFETSHNPLIRKFKPILRSLDSLCYNMLPFTYKYSKLVEIFVVK